MMDLDNAVRVAYLMNQHPYGSCTFIRREIAGVTAAKTEVVRLSIRRPETGLVDPADHAESVCTRYVLGAGALSLVMGVALSAATQPLSFWRAVSRAISIGRRSDRGILPHLAYVVEACMVVKWCRAMAVDHVHAHFGTNAGMVAMFCRLLDGPPYSFTAHGPEEFDRPQQLGLGEKIQRAAFVVGVSEYGRSQLYRWCSYEHWRKIHVVRCGVDEAFIGAPPSPISAQARLVCVGRLCEQKGQLLLVEAAGRLVAAGVRLELVLVGDGPMRGEIEQQIRRLGLTEHVRITGWASGERVREEILAARVMVLPSFAEGLPVVIMEALALGRPVISTYVAGIPELVENGVNGWLVPAGSVEALATAMREALETPLDKLTAMGQAGAKRVAERHNASTEAKKLAALFEGAIREHEMNSGLGTRPPARQGKNEDAVSLVGR